VIANERIDWERDSVVSNPTLYRQFSSFFSLTPMAHHVIPLFSGAPKSLADDDRKHAGSFPRFVSKIWRSSFVRK
jgi:hypothetical protein